MRLCKTTYIMKLTEYIYKLKHHYFLYILVNLSFQNKVFYVNN